MHVLYTFLFITNTAEMYIHAPVHVCVCVCVCVCVFVCMCVIIRNRYDGVDACLILLYDIISL